MNCDAWNQRYLEGRANWPEEPSSALVAIERELPPGTALDLACGTGRNSIHLARRGWAVTGVDFSDAALEVARERSKTERLPIRWLHKDLLSWTPPASSFDLVLICYLHVPWSFFCTVLEAAERALRPKGTLFVLGHDRTNIEEGTGKPKHLDVTYTADEVAAALSRCTIIDARREKRVPDHGATDRTGVLQIDCVVQAQII